MERLILVRRGLKWYRFDVPPVTVFEFESLIVQPEDSLGTAIVKTYVRLPVLLLKLWRWMMNADGTITTEFRDWLCAGCQALEVDAIINEGGA